MNRRMQFVIAIIFAALTCALGQSNRKAFDNALSLSKNHKDLILEKMVLRDILKGKIIVDRGPFDSEHPNIYWQLTQEEQNTLSININTQVGDSCAYSKILSVKRIINQGDTSAIIIIMSSMPGPASQAHSATAQLGYAIYHKEADGQIKVTKNYGLLTIALWGNYEDPLHEVLLGINKHGFLLKGSSGVDGNNTEVAYLLARVNDSLYDAIEVVTYADNYGMYRPPNHACWSYKSILHFNSSPTREWYDLYVYTSGTHAVFNKLTRKSHVKPFKEKHQYIFNGKQYIEK